MPKIPSYNRQVAPSTNVGAAPISPSAANVNAGAIGQGLQALGGGVSDIGQAIFKIEQQKKQIRDESAIAESIAAENNYEFETQRRINNTVYLNPKDAQNDREQSAKGLKELRQSRKTLMSAESYAQYENWSIKNESSRLRTFEGEIYKKEAKLAVDTTGVVLNNNYKIINNPLSTPQQIERANESIVAVSAGNAKYFAPGQLEELKVRSNVASMKALGLDGDLTQFDKAKEIVQSSSVFSAEESLSELQRIEIMKKSTQNRAKDEKYRQKLAVNDEFVSQLINKEINPDDVQNSILDKKTSSDTEISKTEWMEYISSSFEPRPTETTASGMDVALTTVIGYSQGKISKEQAYRDLLDSSYIYGEITDSDFQWAVDKINNKYPVELANSLEVVMKDNTKSTSGWWLLSKKAEQNNARDVNAKLRDWVDSEIKSGKMPTEKEMYNKSAFYIANIGRDLPDNKQQDIQDEDLGKLSDDELLKRINSAE